MAGWFRAGWAGMLLLGACTVTVPAPVPPGGALPANGAWGGTYHGVGTLVAGRSMECARQISVSDFHVTADRVSYSGYFGMIRPDGVAILEADGPIIEGRFNAGVYTGTVRATRDGCSYSLRVARVGP